MTKIDRHVWVRWGPLLILLLAFVLRIHRLDTQSFAFDEGWTSYAIHHSWSEILPVLAPDNHPPLYYILVKALAEVAGYNDFVQRFPSVLSSMLVVTGLYTLGKRLGGTTAGLSAALLAACSPLQIYYAQEARMYSLLMALSVLSLYCMIRLFNTSRPLRWWAAYVLISAAALYTQYFALLMLFAQNIIAMAFIFLLDRRQARAMLSMDMPQEETDRTVQSSDYCSVWVWTTRWIISQFAICLLLVPWIPTALRQIQIGQGTWWRVPLPVRMLLTDIWLFFTVGPSRPFKVDKFGPLTAGLVLAFLVALLLGWRRRWRAWAFVASALLIPVFSVVFGGNRRPIYTDRYTLVAAPMLPLFIGLGIASCAHTFSNRPYQKGQPRYFFKMAWARGLALVAAIALLSAAVVGPLPHLVAYYAEPLYWREDFRRAAQYVMDTSGQGDVVIMLGAYQPLMQYYQGEADVVRFPIQGDSVQNEQEVVDALSQIVTSQSQIRLVMHSWPTVDPQALVEGMLRASCRLQGEHWQRETGQRPIKLLNFEACVPFKVEPRQTVQYGWDDQIALTDYRLVHFQPDKQAHVFLWWQTLRRPDKNYSTFVHLLDAEDKMITQYDHIPLSDFYPMRSWPVRTPRRDDYPLNIPPGTDLDGAWLAVGVYDRDTMQRLPVFDQHGVMIGDFMRITLDETTP